MAFPFNPIQGTTHGIDSRVWLFNGYAWDRVDASGVTGATGARGATGATGATGAGGALGYWGSFWSTQDQGASFANTEYKISFNNTDPDSSGVYISNNSRINFQYAGVYSIIYSVQFVNTDNQIQDVNIWLKKNGSNVADTDSKWSVVEKHGSVDGHAIGSVNYVVKVNANDYLELAWQTTDTKLSLQYIGAISPAPAIPSVILTATQVMYTQLGPTGPTGPAGAAGTLDDLSDVTITGACGNDVLYYDSNSNIWINKSVNALVIDGGLY
jgi:hypothetical protein